VTVEVKVDVCNYCYNIPKLHFTRLRLFTHISCQTSRLSVGMENKCVHVVIQNTCCVDVQLAYDQSVGKPNGFALCCSNVLSVKRL